MSSLREQLVELTRVATEQTRSDANIEFAFAAASTALEEAARECDGYGRDLAYICANRIRKMVEDLE